MNRELLDLLSAARDETISSGDLARLEESLKRDPELRRFYLRWMQLHSLLETSPPEADDASMEESLGSSKIVRLPRRLAVAWLGAAAALTVAAMLGYQSFTGDRYSLESRVATLLLDEDCAWNSISAGLAEGQRLGPGSLWLERGSAVVRFDGGAELVLSGDTRIDLLSAGGAALHHGEVVVRADNGAEGFVLETPTGDLVDLGTEFGVKVDASGTTELHVHEGEVAAGESIVPEGRAVRFDISRGRDGKDVELAGPRFSEIVRQANPRERRDLMQVYDGFHVEEGVYQPADLDQGMGWKGPWRLRTPDERGLHGPDTFPDMRISHGRMNMAWPVKGGRLGMLEMPPGRNIRLREFADPIDLSEDGITFLSFLAAEGETAEIPGKRDDFRITLRSSEDYFGDSLSFGWSKDRIPRVQTRGGPMRRAVREIPADETVFCVAKLIRSDRGSDEIFFRFYRESDDLDILEPADWDIEIRDADLATRFNLLLITAHGDSVRFVDEIRIGPTWRSVTPIDRSPRDPQS